jgi:hypothetical protein
MTHECLDCYTSVCTNTVREWCPRCGALMRALFDEDLHDHNTPPPDNDPRADDLSSVFGRCTVPHGARARPRFRCR